MVKCVYFFYTRLIASGHKFRGTFFADGATFWFSGGQPPRLQLRSRKIFDVYKKPIDQLFVRTCLVDHLCFFVGAGYRAALGGVGFISALDQIPGENLFSLSESRER